MLGSVLKLTGIFLSFLCYEVVIYVGKAFTQVLILFSKAHAILQNKFESFITSLLAGYSYRSLYSKPALLCIMC